MECVSASNADLGYVLLYDRVLSCSDLLGVLEDHNSLTLTAVLRLCDEGCVFVCSTEGLEVTVTAERVVRIELCTVENMQMTYSAGMHHDLGKTLYSLGKSLNILFMFLASRSLRHISDIPGK